MAYINKETLIFAAKILREGGWTVHSEATTGYFLQKEVSVSEALRGRLLSPDYVPYEALMSSLKDGECLVQITEVDGVDVVSAMFEPWHGTKMQYSYNRLKGYYAVAVDKPIYKKVSKDLYYAIRFAA